MKTLSVSAAGGLAAELESDLGKDAAGAYYDAEARSLVVNVMDQDAADAVREVGGKARVVKNSLAELVDAREALTEKATIAGTSWSTDPVTNRIVVTADATVDGSDLNRLKDVVADLGETAQLKRSTDEFRKFSEGGDGIYTRKGGNRLGVCSLGFNVIKDGRPHFLTAGHCGARGTKWSTDTRGRAIGTMVDSRFPGNDYALVRYADGQPRPSAIDLYNGRTQRIARAVEATVGMQVRRSGITTQLHSGKVTGLDATVNYGNGEVVRGLIQTNVCAENGDSGGAMFAGTAAVGITSGGSGDCASGGTTFFQPVTEALAAYGATIN